MQHVVPTNQSECLKEFPSSADNHRGRTAGQRACMYHSAPEASIYGRAQQLPCLAMPWLLGENTYKFKRKSSFNSSVTGSCCGKIKLFIEGMVTIQDSCCHTLAVAELAPLLCSEVQKRLILKRRLQRRLFQKFRSAWFWKFRKWIQCGFTLHSQQKLTIKTNALYTLLICRGESVSFCVQQL